MAAQFNGTVAQKVIQWFRNVGIVTGRDNASLVSQTLHAYRSAGHRDDIVRLVTRLDLGIDDIVLAEAKLPSAVPDGLPDELRTAFSVINEFIAKQNSDTFTIKTVHTVYDEDGKEARNELSNLDHHESEGTRKLFSLAGMLLTTLREGRILIIDELDARLHPLLTREIIRLFSAPDNPHHAQLIFTTQDINLLDNRLLRRDQIWFVEKNRQAATRLYSLAEFRVRNDQAFERNYIQGRYGAVPFLGDIPQAVKAG